MNILSSDTCPVFTYLYEDQPRTIHCKRIDNLSIEVVFADEVKRVVKYNVRDQRALVIFDGDIPYCGLRKKGTQIDILTHQVITMQHEHVRKLQSYELPCLSSASKSGKFIVNRRAILLPAGRSTVIRYRQYSLAPWYCTIDVSYKDNSPKVLFLNSNY